MQKKLTIQRAILTLAAVSVMLALPGSALAAKPVCGDDMCQGNEKTTCPIDCQGLVVGGQDIPLCVTLTGGNVTGDDVMDNTYCNVETGVTAIIQERGGHFILTVHDTVVTGRSIGIDFSDCVPDDEIPDNTALCADRDFPQLVGEAGKSVDDPELTEFIFSSSFDFDLLNMGEGEEGVGVGLRLGFRLDGDPNIKRIINFTSTPREGVCLGDNVTVSRLTEGCWLMESIVPGLGEEGGEGCHIRRNSGVGRSTNSVIKQGTYNMPFLLELEDQTPGIEQCPD